MGDNIAESSLHDCASSILSQHHIQPDITSNNEEANAEILLTDRYLPIANIGNIMKKVLPPQTKVSKDSKELVQECLTEFISFITSESADTCNREKRKTIYGNDIICSLDILGFDNYVEPMRIYSKKYDDANRSSKPQKKIKVNIEENIHHSDVADDDSG
jgi:nuclear transcription Y subunit beta